MCHSNCFCPQYWCPIVRHWAHSITWFLLYQLRTIYITEDLINCFHQMWDTLAQTKFVKSTTITVSLSFMSTPLSCNSSDDFEQSKNTIFMKHPPASIIVCLTPSKYWLWHHDSSWSILWLSSVYLVTTMHIISGNHELGMTLCFDHVIENEWSFGCRAWQDSYLGLSFVHSVTVYSVTIHKVRGWTPW